MTGYVFTGNLDLAKEGPPDTQPEIPFFNADIDCRLLKYEMYAGSRRKTAIPVPPNVKARKALGSFVGRTVAGHFCIVGKWWYGLCRVCGPNQRRGAARCG